MGGKNAATVRSNGAVRSAGMKHIFLSRGHGRLFRLLLASEMSEVGIFSRMANNDL